VNAERAKCLTPSNCRLTRRLWHRIGDPFDCFAAIYSVKGRCKRWPRALQSVANYKMVGLTRLHIKYVLHPRKWSSRFVVSKFGFEISPTLLLAQHSNKRALLRFHKHASNKRNNECLCMLHERYMYDTTWRDISIARQGKSYGQHPPSLAICSAVIYVLNTQTQQWQCHQKKPAMTISSKQYQHCA